MDNKVEPLQTDDSTDSTISRHYSWTAKKTLLTFIMVLLAVGLVCLIILPIVLPRNADWSNDVTRASSQSSNQRNVSKTDNDVRVGPSGSPCQCAPKVAFQATTSRAGVGYETVSVNVGAHFDNKTGEFTAPVNGIFQFSISVTHAGSKVGLLMRVNGEDQRQHVIYGTSPSDFATTTSALLLFALQTGDVVSFSVETRSTVSGQTRSFIGTLVFETTT